MDVYKPMIKKNKVSSVAILTVANIIHILQIGGLKAQPAPNLDIQCRQRIEIIKSRISRTQGGLRVAKMGTSVNDSPFPNSRYNLSFLITGPASESFMRSPVLANSISREVILACPPISSVSFSPLIAGRNETLLGSGWVEVFGSIEHRENVMHFQCAKPQGRGGCGMQKPKWGEIDCAC